jgi:DNA-binding CsgD family transcriptional regulator
MRLRREDERRIGELSRRLGTLVAGDPPALEWAIPEVVQLVHAEKGLAFGLVNEEPNLGIDFLFGQAIQVPAVRADMAIFLRQHSHGWAAYDPVRPEPSQRNRALSVVGMLGWRALERLPMYTELCARHDMTERDQLRVLLCDGHYLAAWVGGFRREPFSPYERLLLQSIVPALQRRVVLERRIGGDALARRELDAMLEPLGAPAFVVRTGVAVAHANQAGRALLKRSPTLAERLCAGESLPEFDVTELACWGLSSHQLAIFKVGQSDAASLAARAARSWRLTPRERQVLELVTRGLSNKDIGTALKCSAKTVEVHVTSLLRKSGREKRTALAAAVWGDSPRYGWNSS